MCACGECFPNVNFNKATVLWIQTGELSYEAHPLKQGGRGVGLDFKAVARKRVPLCAMTSASEVFISSPLPRPAGCSPLLLRLDNGAMDAHTILSWLDGSAHPEFIDRQSLAFALTTLNLPGSSTPGHSWWLQLQRAVSSWGLFGTYQGLGPVACCSSFLESFALCSYVPSVAFTP